MSQFIRHPNRLSALAGLVASLVSLGAPAIASAQAHVRVHSFNGGIEYYTGSTWVGFFKPNDPEEHFIRDAAHPGLLDLEEGKTYRLVQVVAGDLSGGKCTLVTLSDQGSIVAPGKNDTSDVNVNVEFKYCTYYIGPNYFDEDTAARGDIHFHANESWTGGYASNGQPILMSSGAVNFDCHLSDTDADCDRGDQVDKAIAYGTQVSVTYSPHDHNRVYGRNPFTGEQFRGAPNAPVTLTGVANKTLDFGDIYFSTVRAADGSIALTGSIVHDTVVTATFHAHNAGPDSTIFGVFVQGNTVVRAGAGQVAKVEITTPAGTCVQTTVLCAIVALRAGASADVTVKTTTARLGDGSSAAVGANSCATITIASDPDESHTSDNSASCVSGTSTPVTVAVTTGSNPPASQTVAVGSTNVPVIQFAMTPASPVTLDDVTLTASGSGSDHIDITAVKLYVDANANGQVDASESALANGTFAANNGTVTLAVAPPYTVSAPTSFLVTYDFNTTLASRYGGVLVLAGLLPVFFVPRKRRRTITGTLILVAGLGVASIGLGACGSDSTGPKPPPGGSVTFTATLGGMTASGTAVSGVSVSGATITIAK